MKARYFNSQNGKSSDGNINIEAVDLLQQLKYSRKTESGAGADELAVRILKNSGYRANGIIALFEKIKENNGRLNNKKIQKALTYLSTHPRLGNRVLMIKAVSSKSKFPEKNYRHLNDQEWQELKNICQEIIPSNRQTSSSYL
ncbi:MAG: putative Zn-dependent protease [Rickettsiales bacterium]|jgi:predicted Zn-dependent protease